MIESNKYFMEHSRRLKEKWIFSMVETYLNRNERYHNDDLLNCFVECNNYFKNRFHCNDCFTGLGWWAQQPIFLFVLRENYKSFYREERDYMSFRL